MGQLTPKSFDDNPDDLEICDHSLLCDSSEDRRPCEEKSSTGIRFVYFFCILNDP